MEMIFNLLKIILPAITTGLFTFLITKYTYNRNRPTDKIEIAYDRIYYPLYRILFDENNNDVNIIISKIKPYIKKYDKYIDISTKRIFEALYNCNKEAEKKSIYMRFKNNVYNRNLYLRRRLGYLEPDLIQSYQYLGPYKKIFFRISIEVGLWNIFWVLAVIVMDLSDKLFTFMALLLVLIVIIIFLEIIGCVFRYLYFKIRK